MKTVARTASLFFVFVIMAITCGQAIAQEQPAGTVALPIAIVDMKTVRQNSSAMVSIRDQISTYRTGFQTQIQKEEEELRAANQELARQRTILSADAFAEERKKFETRLAEVQQLVQKRRQDLDQLREAAMVSVQDNLNQVVAEIASERGIALVLNREQTVLAARSLEITDEVVARLNKKLPNVVVPPPGN